MWGSILNVLVVSCAVISTVLSDDCRPKHNDCGSNEIFNDCKKACPPETCIALVAKFACAEDQPCEAACACKPGFFRKEEGSPCIPSRQCPQMANAPDPDCGPNEFFNPCKKECPPETCISILADYRCDPEQPCQAACACKPGFLREDEGTPCIPSEECPQNSEIPEPQCGVNEEYKCRASCPVEKCTPYKIGIACPRNQTCDYGCWCIDDYRRLDGECIPEDQCPKLGKGK